MERLVESATRAYRAGQAGECAAACARLTELHPEELETLVLVGSSLFRWGNARTAASAFQCAFNRQSELAGIHAAQSRSFPASTSAASTAAFTSACSGFMIADVMPFEIAIARNVPVTTWRLGRPKPTFDAPQVVLQAVQGPDLL